MRLLGARQQIRGPRDPGNFDRCMRCPLVEYLVSTDWSLHLVTHSISSLDLNGNIPLTFQERLTNPQLLDGNQGGKMQPGYTAEVWTVPLLSQTSAKYNISKKLIFVYLYYNILSENFHNIFSPSNRVPSIL